MRALLITQKKGWKPGPNTLLYLPLESDVVDKSGKSGRTFTTSGLSYTTVGGVPSVHVGTTGGIYLKTPYPIVDTNVHEQTISILVYTTIQQTSARRTIIEWRVQNKVGTSFHLYENTNQIRYVSDTSSVDLRATFTVNQWQHIVVTNNASGSKLYLNGQLISSGVGSSSPRGSWQYSYENAQGTLASRNGDYSEGLNGNARELIAEDKIWTAQEVADYNTRIKSRLGI